MYIDLQESTSVLYYFIQNWNF